MSILLAAKPVVQDLKEKIRNEINTLTLSGIKPTIGIIRVGDRPDDVAYEKSIIKSSQSMGIECEVFAVDQAVSNRKLSQLIKQVNADKHIHGIMVFRPLPPQIDIDKIKYLIDPDKDIDCMNPLNLAKLFEGKNDGFVPCTPAAVMETLKHYQVPLKGANVVIIGRSLVVGKPLSIMLLQEDATVTVCHSKTRNLAETAQKADILVAAMGKARFVDKFVNRDQVVIDVGINQAENDGICGDVDYEKAAHLVQAITPVPGGVGTVTTSILLKHVVQAAKKLAGR